MTGESRLRRLSHEQWANTVIDLLRLPEGEGTELTRELATSFRDDPTLEGYPFSGQASAMLVDSPLFLAYQRAAASLAEHVSSNDETREALGLDLGQASDDEAVRDFIRAFGLRAHRQPLSDEDVERYFEVYQFGQAAYEGDPSVVSGVRLLLQSFLQSPWFVFRVETTVAAGEGATAGEALTELSPFERATRLSYFLWESMPDDELLAAAETGELSEPEVFQEQVERLARDQRAEAALYRFLVEYFEVETFGVVKPMKDAYANTSNAFGPSAQHETELFLQREVVEEGGGVRELLTSNRSYVNAEMALVYGLEGTFGEGFTPVELSAFERPGVLTRAGFLSRNARNLDPDTIHRGIFVARELSCLDIPAPPAEVPNLPETSGLSNREVIVALTEQPDTVCRNCHEPVINPFGFAFEHYGVAGEYRETDDGDPVDASANVLVDGESAPVNGAAELMVTLAESEQVHRCIADKLMSFAQGRSSDERDAEIIGELLERSRDEEAPFQELVMHIAFSDAFRVRREANEE
jgi:hypothetical protein